MPSAHQWRVDEEAEGRRLDVYLATMLGASRNAVRRLLEHGRIQLDERVVPPREKGRRLAVGETVAVSAFTPRAAERPLPDEDAELTVLASGPGWLAVDKPAGMPVHPLDAAERGTVLNAVAAMHPELVGVGEGGLRSGVVHRLDVDTSGVLLVATQESRWQSLRSAFRRHRVRKCYRALVHGTLEGEGALELHLTVSQHRPARVRVVAPDDPAHGRRTRLTKLRWRSLECHAETTLVEVRPRTGFLHQIRASLAQLGHPIVGDPAYGAPESTAVSRHLLHAASVEYGEVRAASPDAEDFRRALESVRG